MKTTLTALFALLCLCVTAQNETVNWHFGSGHSVNFSNTLPVVGESNLATTVDSEPAVISDEEGNLIMYSDGLNLYSSDGAIMPNGVFTFMKTQNIIIPVPNEPDLFYIVRSDNSGTDYSLVDMTLNDGLGDIVPQEKEIVISSFSARLMSTSHAIGEGRWLILAENENGQNDVVFMKIFDVTSAGFTLNFEQDYAFLWAGWFSQLNDAAISPDCSKIVTSFKGHYIAFFEFDNSTGEISDYLTESINVGVWT